jgi:UDP-N-acetylmuramoyl-tripeptide--D-alanyl-D-alanine ligase
MRSSLHVLGYAKGRRVAVLGDMAELGPDEIRFHEQIGEFAAETKPDLLVGIGERSRALVEAARRTDPELKAVHFDDAEDFIAESGKLLKEGDIVLIKASHCMEFSKIVEALS